MPNAVGSAIPSNSDKTQDSRYLGPLRSTTKRDESPLQKSRGFSFAVRHTRMLVAVISARSRGGARRPRNCDNQFPIAPHALKVASFVTGDALICSLEAVPRPGRQPRP